MNKTVLAAISGIFFVNVCAVAQSASAPNSELAWNARPKLEVVTSVATAHVFRFEDKGFGNHVNFGVGVEAPVWRKLRLGGEIDRTFGFSPGTAKCGRIGIAPNQPLPCAGTAREGVSSATAGSFTASYFFGESRIQPYVLGGLSVLKATEYTSAATIRQNVVQYGEIQYKSTGIGPAFGAGLRVSIDRHLSVRSELRFSDGTSRSGSNLSQVRMSIGAAYGW
jgi:hypothetical protein